MTTKSRNGGGGEKSTVMKIRDGFGWGRTLYDACHVFNDRFADYLEDYARRYDAGEIVADEDGSEKNSLIAERDRLLAERKVLRDAVRKASADKVDAYRRYARELPLGQVVSDRRKAEAAGGELEIGRYIEMINGRHALNEEYRKCVEREKEAIAEERKHIDAHMFMTRTLNRQVRNIGKMLGMHRYMLDHPMSDDVPAIAGLLRSEGQTERLMAVCLNILNTYSEGEFGTVMGMKDKEQIADLIADAFSKFEQNYDFAAGCYDADDARKVLVLKPLDVLAKKIYNGYYFTIRGCVQRSYASVRMERFNIESIDANWEEEDDNGNHGIDRLMTAVDTMAQCPCSPDPKPLDEGMLDIWTDCNRFLLDNIGGMSDEVASELSSRFPRNPYYHNASLYEKVRMMMSLVIGGIDGELVSGNVIGGRLKHIVLDAMGGAESSEEWRQNVDVVSRIMSKYIHVFFSGETCRQSGDE